jgi:hypothetical protein
VDAFGLAPRFNAKVKSATLLARIETQSPKSSTGKSLRVTPNRMILCAISKFWQTNAVYRGHDAQLLWKAV